MAEDAALKAVQCGFESHYRHMNIDDELDERYAIPELEAVKRTTFIFDAGSVITLAELNNVLAGYDPHKVIISIGFEVPDRTELQITIED